MLKPYWSPIWSFEGSFCLVFSKSWSHFGATLGASFVLKKDWLTRFPQAHSTDFVLCSLCPPRRWSDAKVGICMLMGHLLSAIRCWMITFLFSMGHLMLNDSLGYSYYQLFLCWMITFLENEEDQGALLQNKKV